MPFLDTNFLFTAEHERRGSFRMLNLENVFSES